MILPKFKNREDLVNYIVSPVKDSSYTLITHTFEKFLKGDSNYTLEDCKAIVLEEAEYYFNRVFKRSEFIKDFLTFTNLHVGTDGVIELELDIQFLYLLHLYINNYEYE